MVLSYAIHQASQTLAISIRGLIGGVTWQAFDVDRIGCPVGTTDNSPPIYRFIGGKAGVC